MRLSFIKLLVSENQVDAHFVFMHIADASDLPSPRKSVTGQVAGAADESK